MAITVEAVYENGVLKLEKPLPFAEHERVEVSVRAKQSVARESAGMLRWTGDWDTLRQIAEDDDFGLMESPRPSTSWSRPPTYSLTPIRSSTTSRMIRNGERHAPGSSNGRISKSAAVLPRVMSWRNAHRLMTIELQRP
ncbi:MAG: antitoxin family protein [Gemmataceae bacterium]